MARADRRHGGGSAAAVHARGAAAGWLLGFCAVLGHEPGSVAEISAIYVEPAAWRQGAGGALMAQTLGRLRAAGAAEVTLWVFAANEPARAFYARYGFTPDGATGEDAGAPEIRMRTSLASSDLFRGHDQEL